MLLTPRQSQIFQAIVEDYISFAEPVGSRTISKKFNMQISSATIRNEMADLEELGLIAQPHLSSGRVPTQKGLRFYIDCLVEIDRLSKEEEDLISNIKKEYEVKKQHIRNLMKDISKTLSNVLQCPSMVTIPRLLSESFKKIQFLLLDETNLVITIVAKTGLIEHFETKIDNFGTTQEKLNEIAKTLNTLPDGFTLQQVNSALETGGGIKGAKQILSSSGMDLNNADERIFLNGTENIFKNPEFQDSENVKLFIRIFNDKEKLLKIIDDNKTRTLKNDTLILIGNELIDLESLSLGLVASEYRASTETNGIIGIIGPSRMDYCRAISLIREMATKISDIFIH